MVSVSPQRRQHPPAARSWPHAWLVTGDPATWDASTAFRTLREQAPVQQVVLPGNLGTWLITDAAQARQALADARLAHDMRRLPDPRMGFGGYRYPDDIFSAEGRHPLNSDGTAHHRLRNVLAPLLSRMAARRWKPFIAQTSAALLDSMATNRPTRPGHRLRPSARRPGHRGTPRQPGRSAAPPEQPDPGDDQGRRSRRPCRPQTADRLFGLWAHTIGEKRRKPGDDLLTHRILAHSQGHLSAEELVSVAWGLFSGGISPTTTLIASGAIEIMRKPEPRQALRDETAAARLTEELLRITSPFPASVWRFAPDDVPLANAVIPQGAVVMVALAAANRDPLPFPEPDTARPPPAHQLQPGRPPRRSPVRARIEPGADLRHCQQLRPARPHRSARPRSRPAAPGATARGTPYPLPAHRMGRLRPDLHTGRDTARTRRDRAPHLAGRHPHPPAPVAPAGEPGHGAPGGHGSRRPRGLDHRPCRLRPPGGRRTVRPDHRRRPHPRVRRLHPRTPARPHAPGQLPGLRTRGTHLRPGTARTRRTAPALA